MNTTNKEIKEKEERLLSFKQEVEGLRNISDAEEYAKQLAHLFLGNGLSLKTILLMAIDFGVQHPNWISVEDELPPHRNKSNHKFENDFSVNCFVSDGKDVDTGYYDYRLRKWNCEFLTNVVYWYCPQPPRKDV